MSISNQPKQIFIATFVVTLFLKLFLSVQFPVTGDEAFFYQWGQHPAWGFADHPPMIGWWLGLLSLFSDQFWVARLATTALTSLIALGIVDILFRLLPTDHRDNAWWMGSIYLAMPWSWMFVLVTTDTPLVFFMLMSVWFFVRGESAASLRAGSWWYALSGLALGGAFLSKYFAVLMGFSYVAYIILFNRSRWLGLVLIVLTAIPSVLLHLYFNAYHGWVNVMFNLFNRHDDAHWQWESLVIYVLMLVYLMTPWLLFKTLRAQSMLANTSRRMMLVLMVVPLLVLALVALKRSVGLHWVLGFIPLFVVWCGFAIRTNLNFSQLLRFNIYLSIPHFLLIMGLIFSPLSMWDGSKHLEKLVFLRSADEVVAVLSKSMPKDSVLMTTSYSPAAVMAYHHGQYVPVFGEGRHYARQDDLIVDFSQLDERNFRIFTRSPIDKQDFQLYFDEVDVHSFQVNGAEFYWLDGTGFKYAIYREMVLAEIAKKYHDLPKWLPLMGNPFCERYGFGDCSPRRT